MANDSIYSKAAEEALGTSYVIRGREKITTDELIARYPEGVTITEFDVIGSEDKTYPVFAFAEDPTLYFNGGALAQKIVEAWISLTDGDIDAASSGLKSTGGVKFRLEKQKTKQGGKTITVYHVV